MTPVAVELWRGRFRCGAGFIADADVSSEAAAVRDLAPRLPDAIRASGGDPTDESYRLRVSHRGQHLFDIRAPRKGTK